MIELP